MANLLPSEAVKLIDMMFPRAGVLQLGHLSAVAALVNAVDQVPQHLVTVRGDAYLRYLAGVTTLRSSVAVWLGGNKQWEVASTPGYGSAHPIQLVRDALADCRDTLPEPGTAELAFIPDAVFREALRQDISDASTALRDKAWKSATVLAGSVVEALLLFVILQADAKDLDAARADARKRCQISNEPPEWWYLPQYIEVAFSLGRIGEDTAKAARVTRDFRNLIHPGKAIRTGQECHQGTATVALGTLHCVIEDLKHERVAAG